MTTGHTPPATDLLRDAENYLSALHGSVARHDNLGADFACAGCELRDRIAAALPQLATAVEPPADRAAILRWAADWLDARMEQFFSEWPDEPRTSPYALGQKDAAAELRRMADETQPAEHRPSVSRWRVETLDNLADEWAPGTSWPLRELAAERYDLMNAQTPKWKDGTQVRRRLVRETTTYTIEAEVTPAAERQDGPHPTHLGDRANAENCPGCKTERRPLPYPFLCPAQPGDQARP